MNKVGDKIGSIKYYYDNELISEDDVILESKLEISIKKIIKEYFYLFIGIPIIVIIIIVIKKKKCIN